MSISTISRWIELQRESEFPIHVQIEQQIRQAIAGRRLREGSRLPPIRTLASTLDVHSNTVARAYNELVRDGVLIARQGRGTYVSSPLPDDGVEADRQPRLSAIMTRAVLEAASLGFRPEQIETAFGLRMASFRQELKTPGMSARPSRPGRRRGLTLMGSHDLALDLLLTHLRASRNPNITSIQVGSLGGLIALSRGEADVAGCHLLDEETGTYNLPFVKRVLAGIPTVVVVLAGRSQGLLVPRGNPKGIRSIEDILKEDVTIINRQRGSGTRVLLDFLLRQQGARTDELKGYEVEVETHIAVGAAVAAGQADVGMGIFAASRAMDLDFVPVRDERYDLVVPEDLWESSKLKYLRSVLGSRDFKDSVSEIGGYDTSETGTVVASLTG